MKNWFKQQLTEVTAWAGFACVVCAFFAPRWVFLVLGIMLICTDDTKATEWVRKKAPKLSEALDKWLE